MTEQTKHLDLKSGERPARVPFKWSGSARSRIVSPDELFFRKQYIARREDGLKHAALLIGWFYNFFTLAVTPFLAHPLAKSTMLNGHGVILCCTTLAIVPHRFQRVFRGSLYGLLMIVVPMIYLWLARMFIQERNSDQVLLVSMIGAFAATFSILLLTGSKTYIGLFACLLALFSTFCLQGHEYSGTLVLIFQAGLIGSIAFRWLQLSQYIELATREYAMLTLAAPAKIVRHAVESNQSLESAFSPRLRECVCLSSDWRGYQSMSVVTSPEALAEALCSYYEICAALLSKWFPEGNYYTDWIADELFVVAYEYGDQKTQDLVQQMIHFSIDLLSERQRFYQKFGLPSAVDVGISCGQGYIGMMGPSAHKKATAFGEVPGRARRYQSCGKLLRADLCERDRVVFGSDTLLKINYPFAVREYAAGGARLARDISDQAVYFIESMPAEDAILKESPPIKGKAS